MNWIIKEEEEFIREGGACHFRERKQRPEGQGLKNIFCGWSKESEDNFTHHDVTNVVQGQILEGQAGCVQYLGL